MKVERKREIIIDVFHYHQVLSINGFFNYSLPARAAHRHRRCFKSTECASDTYILVCVCGGGSLSYTRSQLLRLQHPLCIYIYDFVRTIIILYIAIMSTTTLSNLETSEIPLAGNHRDRRRRRRANCKVTTPRGKLLCFSLTILFYQSIQ